MLTAMITPCDEKPDFPCRAFGRALRAASCCVPTIRITRAKTPHSIDGCDPEIHFTNSIVGA